MPGSSASEPQQIEKVGQTLLRIRWGDGHESLYPWEFLRGACPCAACGQGGLPIAHPDVRPLEMSPVGRYAIHIRWGDGHTTGIFSHEYLRSLCPCEACRPQEFTEG